ncbi:MAG: DUF6174 domain-containing protein [Anaerolineae bacterium]|nr:DUF6174 domain-containing protein [Anaerolineae bacterium]
MKPIQNRRFTIALLGLIPLVLVMLVLLVVMASRVRERERHLRDQQEELDRQYDLWQQQNINHYTVTYSNSVSCQNVKMLVRDGNVESLTPTCNNSYYGLYGSGLIRPMDELYAWMQVVVLDGQFRDVKIDYHPELHYITRLVIDHQDSASIVEIRYENLKVSQ